MICPYCGKENAEDLEMCDFCGGSLITATEEPIVQTHPPELPDEVSETAAEPQEPPMISVPPVSPPGGGMNRSRIWWIVGCVVFICLVLACVAIVLGLYRYTKTLGFFNPATDTPILLATQTAISSPLPRTGITTPVTPQISTPQISRLLFYDDFSDPNSGWDQVDETNYFSNYYMNAYRIRVDTDMSDSWANPDDRTFGDVVIEVDATKNGGPDDNDFGLICRYLDTDRYYYAVVSSDGYYGISKVAPESTVILGNDSLVYSDEIKQGLATNHIRFDCVGNVLTLYINGQQLDQQTDGDYTSGNVGLLAGTYDTPGTDILFDNFGVYAP